MKTQKELNKIKTCCHLLPPPGGEVVLELLEEIAEKDKEIERLRRQVGELSKELADWKERWKNLYNLCT